MFRRSILFILAFAVGYRVAYVIVDTAGRATLRIPWRDSPRLLVDGATSAVKGRVAHVRAAVDEGRQTARQRERELRVENHLRQTS